MAATTTLDQSELMTVEKPVSRISWGGIFIGAIATIAFGVLFHSLGAAIGLTAINPVAGKWGGNAGLWTGIWSFLSIIAATFLGAWLASRASTVFFKRDAASLGIMTWALSFIAMLFFVTSVAGMAAQTTTEAATAAASTAAQAPGVQAQAGQLQQQAQQGIQQLQPGQIANAAANVGAAASWWFFLTAFFGMLAGLLGGLAGLPKSTHRKQLEVRRTAPVRTRETPA